jgi:hypothetical protein
MISFKSGELSLLLQFSLQSRKGFDNPHQVFVGTDAARIKEERIRDKVAFGEDLPFGVRGVAAEEALVNGFVHNFNARPAMPTNFSMSLLVYLETAKILAAPLSTRRVR